MAGLSLTPTSPAPDAQRCDLCEREVTPRWTGMSWLQPKRCAECAERLRCAQLRDELLAVWLPQAREQFGERRFDLAPMALMDELSVFASRGADRVQSAVYLYGPVGTGKTQQLAWLARRVLELRAGRGERCAASPVMYTTIHRLMRALRADGDAVSAYEVAPWLMLDEIGADELTAWGMANVTDLLEYRMSRNLPTVFSSNISIGDLVQGRVSGWDERIVTRIMEMCGQEENGKPTGIHALNTQRRLKGGAR